MNVDQQQQAAVVSDGRLTLVLAGAGSGKTRVIVSRVQHLVSNGTAPSRILVATFTRRAASEVKSRLRLQGIDTSAMLCGTLHSVCRDLVGDERTVLPQPMAERLLMRCARDLGYYNESKRTWRHGLSKKKITTALDRRYTTGFNIDDAHALKLLQEYRTRLNTTRCTDYGGILLNCLNRLNEMSEAGDDLPIDHVLIDEVQDTDRVQHHIINLLGRTASVFLVGDPRQSIYRWRGAEPENAGGVGSKVEPLPVQHCYRCPANVVDLANRLAANDPYEPCRQPMVAADENAGVVSFLMGSAQQLAYALNEMLKSPGVFHRDIAVLARRHASLEDLDPWLRDMGISTFRVGLEQRELAGSRRAFFAMLCAIDRPDLWMATDDLLDTLQYSVQDRAHAWATARDRNVTLLEGWSILAAGNSARSGGRTYTSVIPDFILEIANDDTVGRACTRWAEVSGCSHEGIAWWVSRFGNRSVRSTVHWLANSDIQDFSTTAEDAVTLSTIHGAKGLEWPIVIVMDVNEGILPKSDDDVTDDRRVLYVAATRAQSRLVLHYRPEGDKVGQWTRCGQHSRFLDEVRAFPAIPPSGVASNTVDAPVGSR